MAKDRFTLDELKFIQQAEWILLTEKGNIMPITGLIRLLTGSKTRKKLYNKYTCLGFEKLQNTKLLKLIS